MATSSSVHTNTYGGRTITLLVEEISTSIENNTSTIQWTLTSGTSSTYHSVYNLGAYVNGNKVYGVVSPSWETRAFPCKNGSTSGTLTIQHNADGTASDVPFKLTGSVFYSTSPVPEYTGSINLTTIPRASTFTLSKTSGGTSTTSFALGDAIYVNITRASNTFTHKVYFKVGNSANQIISNSATTSANTTLASSLAQYIPSTSGTATMYVETYSGSTLVGTKTQTFTISVPSSVVPTINSITKSDTSNLLATYGGYVQGKSSLRVQTSASGNYSTITNCLVKLKNGSTLLTSKTGTDVTFANITYTGTITIEVTITDSRNRTATNNSNTISVLAYTNPNISLLTAERSSSTPSSVTLKFSASITALNNHNGKTFTLQKKKKSDTTWTTLQTYTSGYSYSSNSYTTTCDENYGWDFQLKAQDNFTSSTRTIEIGTAFELMNWKSDGTALAIGKVSEKSNTLEVSLNSEFSGNSTKIKEAIVDNINTKNLLNLNGIITRTANGVTILFKPDTSELTFIGTSTAQTDFNLDFLIGFKFKENIYYTISNTYVRGSTTKALNIYMQDGNNNWQGPTLELKNNNTSYTNKWTNGLTTTLALIRVPNATTFNYYTCKIMLEEGQTATSYTPYQNLDLKGLASSNSGEITISGSTTYGANLTLKGGDLVLSTPIGSSNDSRDIVFNYGNGNEKARLWMQNTPTSTNADLRLQYRVKDTNGTNLITGGIQLQNDFILEKHDVSVTVPANSFNSYNLDAVTIPSGYTLVGVIPRINGYGDQWLVSLSYYSNKVVAMIHSKYNGSLTNTISYYLLFVRSNWFTS